MMHRVDQPMIGRVNFSSSLAALLFAFLLRVKMHRVDHPLIGRMNVSSSLRCCSLSCCA